LDFCAHVIYYPHIRKSLNRMAENANESILRFENVSVSFDETRALANVSFKVPAGETRIIFGAAGSGLVKPNSGHVYVFGQDIRDLSEEALFDLRGKMGVLFQEGGLFDSLTIEENVSYPLLNQRSRAGGKTPQNGDIPNKVREALRFVGLEGTLEKFPSELSGGMRRRAGIARATVTEPPLMLYDSPTAGLDPITANTIVALITKARDTKNTTSMIVTHRYQDGHIMANFRYNPQSGHVERAPQQNGLQKQTVFMVLKEGQLVFEGSQDELEHTTDPYVSKFKAVKV
jgi:phospholipid/cholesterol/gamma-HCH transport system ATP-binding protein